MTGNYEINVEIIDPALAAAMEGIFRTDLSNCLELTAGSGRRAASTGGSPSWC